jgi:hypothetical protein
MVRVNISPTLLNKLIKSDNFELNNFIKNLRYINKVGLDDFIDGIKNTLPLGLFATKTYNIGDVVLILTGELISNPTKTSIHIGNNMHVINEYGRYINHSFEPNCKIELNKVVAINNISKNDEITFNYNESEIKMAEPFFDNGISVCGKN